MVVGDPRHNLEVEYVCSRISDRLGIDRLRLFGDGCLDGVGIVDVHEGDVDAHASQGHVELGVRAAIERP